MGAEPDPRDPRDPPPGRPWLVPMAARDAAEPGRVATPLELLFDLTFVVAVAAVSAQLTHAVAAGHLGSGVLGYLMVFFAIWWAWMNFTWFASAYDSDDVPYRLLTLVQMGGVLVLAAGVPAAFTAEDFTAVTAGYVIMRVAMALQWWRAARGDPDRRATAWRYLGGTAAVQAGWLVRLVLPAEAAFVGFFVLVAAELAVPLLAERRGRRRRPGPAVGGGRDEPARRRSGRLPGGRGPPQGGGRRGLTGLRGDGRTGGAHCSPWTTLRGSTRWSGCAGSASRCRRRPSGSATASRRSSSGTGRCS